MRSASEVTRTKATITNLRRSGGRAEDSPHPVDIHVGAQLRKRRIVMGLTQDRLAKSIGITFQQIQKYERGTNRIVASRLHELAQALEVPVTYFFEGLRAAPPAGTGAPEAQHMAAELSGALAERDTLALVRAYHRIRHPAVRRRLRDLTNALGRRM